MNHNILQFATIAVATDLSDSASAALRYAQTMARMCPPRAHGRRARVRAPRREPDARFGYSIPTLTVGRQTAPGHLGTANCWVRQARR
jgi:hypothetical protein